MNSTHLQKLENDIERYSAKLAEVAEPLEIGFYREKVKMARQRLANYLGLAEYVNGK